MAAAALTVVLGLAGVADGKQARPLLAGSLTWEVNRAFATGSAADRTVTFTLKTAFELDTDCDWRTDRCTGGTFGVGTACATDADTASCVSGGGRCAKMISCTPSTDDLQYGVLCVDQYTTTTGASNPTSKIVLNPTSPGSDYSGGVCKYDQGAGTGTRNSFEVVNVGIVNGVKVVYGKKTHTVTADADTVAMIAYFSNNVDGQIPGRRGVLGPTQGVLMPQCDSPNPSRTPCGVNIHDSSPGDPVFGLYRKSNYEPHYPSATSGSSVRESVYWGTEASFSASWPSSDVSGTTSLFQQSPALETMVHLCSTSLTKWACQGGNTTETVTNFYSPVPAMAAFPQFAVTPLTQKAGATHPVGKYHWFRDGAESYKAPHPPLWLKSWDYDGHMMTVYDYNSAIKPLISNRRLECFDGESNGAYEVTSPGQQAWPFFGTSVFGTSGEKKCVLFFGDERSESRAASRGNLMKLDFDFGAPNSSSLSASEVYSDVWFRCPNTNAICDANTLCGGSAAESPCSGSRMFSSHVVATVDLPYPDVDNTLRNQNFDLQAPQYWTTSGNPRSAIAHVAFSAYGCFSGNANQPPRFVRTLDRAAERATCNYVPGSSLNDTLVESEVTCRVGQPCEIPLFARDFGMDGSGASAPDTQTCPSTLFTAGDCDPSLSGSSDMSYQSCDVVQIYRAEGWDEPGRNMTLSRAHCALAPGTPCNRDADCGPSQGLCTGSGGADVAICESSEAELGAVKCYHREDFAPEDAGKYFVRCFAARDPQGDLTFEPGASSDPRLAANHGVCSTPNKHCHPDGYDPVAGTKYPPGYNPADRFTCSSAPMCVRIFVDSASPAFVAPTPLELNSRDDMGRLVEGRTDVGACEGYPLRLELLATDADAGERVRIYLSDDDVQGANVDFFANLSSVAGVPPSCAGTVAGASAARWSGFTGYAALKRGDNAGQASAVATVPGSDGRKSLISAYGGDVEYVPSPRLGVAYTLSPALRNGIVTRNADPLLTAVTDPAGESCRVGDDAGTPDDNDCREKLINMDQVVCAYAYDDSHTITGRWMGRRNPNPNTGLREHSNGDHASPRHCWRVRMQAPPVFVTGPDKEASPFAEGWDLAAETGAYTTDVEASYRTLQATVGVTVSHTFVVADPNPDDSVEVFLLGNPAPPGGLEMGRTVCIPTAGRCGAADSGGGGGVGLAQDKASTCSKGKATLTWTPGPEHAGEEVRVCLQARDSSTLCHGSGPPDATASGWYGEKLCVKFLVGRPRVLWHGTSDVVSSGTAVQSAFVGCAARIVGAAYDQGGGHVAVSASGALPEGATFSSAAGVVGEGVVTWVPKRGMEGGSYTVCFSARDAAGVLDPLPPACRTAVVQRCQYCVRGGDTLGSVMKEYGLDTNWLRLWLHNGNENPAGSGLPRIVANPDLMVGKRGQLTADERRENSLGQPVVWVGPVYEAQEGDGLALLARKFRTTVASLLSVNPDIQGEGDVAPGRPVCLVPCSAARHGWEDQGGAK